MAAGIGVPGSTSGRGTPASMRPRPNGRGNSLDRDFCAPNTSASMRPRPNGRGNEPPTSWHSAHLTGFNEAAAEWPRESGQRSG